MNICETNTIALSTLIGIVAFQVIGHRSIYPALGLLTIAAWCKSALGAKHKSGAPFQDTRDHSRQDMLKSHALNICLGLVMAYVLFLVFPRSR